MELGKTIHRLVEEGGVSAADMDRIHRTAVEVAFTDESTRAALRAKVGAAEP